jgi:DNA-directed RNA polymerase subunit RPC12/RpoP
MASVVDEVYCRNCSELLFHVVRHDDGTTVMKESAPEPESNGIQKYYRCPTCQGKNLVMLIEEPRGCRYYEVAGFIRS